MAKISIVIAEGKGILDKEVLWLLVNEDVSLESYMVCDSTYTDPTHISNKLRHVYWLPNGTAKKGDYIALYTKIGQNNTAENTKGSKTHRMYWGLKETVWNKDGDCAVLFPVAGWTTAKV